MDFYSSIYSFYDSIFPLKSEQVDFVLKQSGNSPMKILDAGCATGSLAIELAKKGNKVEAIDLDHLMIVRAGQKAQNLPVGFQVLDMLHIDKAFLPGQFDRVLCFGNTLVHLPGFNDMEVFFEKVFTVLKHGGKFMVQILNYDFITENKISELPLIENQQVKFTRKYEFLPNGKIRFNTLLLDKINLKEIANSIVLTPIRKVEIEKILQKVGFLNIRFSSSFATEEYNYKSLPLIISAKK